MTDAHLARTIAYAAGNLLLEIQADGADGARGDREANSLILDMLRRERPNDAILSEESTDDLARLRQSRVWIVDPLDGTREFAEGREDWAVHIGLAVDGIASVGAVALPRQAVTIATDAPPPLPDPATVPRMLVSRSRPSDLCAAVARALPAHTIGMGSAGAKAMAVVQGKAEIYLHSGGQHQWDNCAPVAVAIAAGLHASRIDGSPLVYNAADTNLPDLLICRPELAKTILSLVAREIG